MSGAEGMTRSCLCFLFIVTSIWFSEFHVLLGRKFPPGWDGIAGSVFSSLVCWQECGCVRTPATPVHPQLPPCGWGGLGSFANWAALGLCHAGCVPFSP